MADTRRIPRAGRRHVACILGAVVAAATGPVSAAGAAAAATAPAGTS